MTIHPLLPFLFLIVGFGLLLALPATIQAQVEFGGLYGSVTDGEGTKLPGVSISLDGPGATQLQISGRRGNFHFPRLDPGIYSLKAELEGFSPLEHTDIDIRAGRNSTLALQISAAVEDTITVTGESPLLDERKLSQGTLITAADIERIPTAGDVYSMVNQAPGVMIDRIDVGGSRTLTISFTAPGVGSGQNDFLLDGVQVTDMGFEGRAPMYFDMEQFNQVDLSTGGNEISKATAGVSINLVTKRGTNELRGSARFFVTDEDLFWFFKQSSPDVDPDDFPPGQQNRVEATQIHNIQNYGLEVGGPVIRNRLWLWGSYGRSDYSATAVGGFPRDDEILNAAFRLNAQLSDANSLVASLNHGDKHDDHLGLSFARSLDSSLKLVGNGAGLDLDGAQLIKVEDSHMFSPRLFLTGMGSYFDGGWGLISNGCVAAGGCDAAVETVLDANGVWQNSYQSGTTTRPSTEWKIDGSYFLGSRNTSHELRFGGRYREFESNEAFHWPGGRDLFHIALEPPIGIFIAQRGEGPPVSQDYTSLWVQDTMTSGRWTLNAGLRYDLQRGENPAFSVPANPAVPEYLPALEFEGNDGGGFDWESVSPRIGVTYALGEEREKLLRASYSRFASALGRSHIDRLNPVAPAYGYFYFYDANGNNMWDGRQEEFFLGYTSGYDENNPTDLSSPNRTDPDLEPELTDEIILGLEHAVRPELVVGLNVMWRNTTGILEERDFLRVCETDICDSGPVRLAGREDYIFDRSKTVTQPNGQPYTVDIYALDSSRFQFTGGDLLLNGDREVEYLGASVTMTKRLSHQWMLRGFINYGKPTWIIPDSFFVFDDPTDYDAFSSDRYDNDGDVFAEGAGRFSQLIMQSNWSFNLNGTYQIAPDRPWGFNVAGNIYGREGYPIPLWVRANTSQSRKEAQAMASADDFRYDDVYTIDLRVEKDFAAWSRSSFTLSADLFNALNSGVVLERETRLDTSIANFVLETLSPRIWRLGVRINWR